MIALAIGSFVLMLIGFCLLLAGPDNDELKLVVLCFILGMAGLMLQAILPIFL